MLETHGYSEEPSGLYRFMISMCSDGAACSSTLKVMLDGLSSSARVPARILHVSGRGVMIDFVRGWRRLRVDRDGFIVQVGFAGSLLDIGGVWSSVAYAHGDGAVLVNRGSTSRLGRGLISMDDNVMLVNFQKW